MADPRHHREDLDRALAAVSSAARAYLEGIEQQPARLADSEQAITSFGGPLPQTGAGTMDALRRLLSEGIHGAVRSPGPHYFHFVTGGVTPAALAADWLTSTLDQNPASWVGSPLGTRLEMVSLDWLKELFDLPESWGGVLTTGATMANFTGMAAARRWCGLRQGIDVDEVGMSHLRPIRVLSSGYLHSSARKALGMLGIGRAAVHILSRDTVGRLDLRALEHELQDLGGDSVIVIANAGEVNAGDFDPISAIADLTTTHSAWLHVDGAFGLFARVSPRTARLAQGVERADSVISDGHKWLNVPYDCGFAFVRDPSLLSGAFTSTAVYLSPGDQERPSFGDRGPEQSRRARALPVWATLAAYGREGYQAMVERHLDLAQYLARRVDDALDLERLAEAPLNIVCFRFHPDDMPEDQLDDLNRRLGEMVLSDGRVYFGTTVYGGRVAFRPAIVNWLTTQTDVDLIVDVTRELGAQLTRSLQKLK